MSNRKENFTQQWAMWISQQS